MEYKCNKCDSISESSEWNDTTIEDLKEEGMYSGKFTKIESINFEQIETQFYYFKCPQCFENCYIEDGHITEIIKN